MRGPLTISQSRRRLGGLQVTRFTQRSLLMTNAFPSIFYAIFSDQLRTRLPQQLAAYAVGAGLPIDQLRPFVATYATLGPVQAAQLPGVTPQILAAAGLGKQWAYAESLHYLW